MTGGARKSILAKLALMVTCAAASAQSTSPSTGTSAPVPIVVVGSVEAFWSADQYAKDSGYVTEVRADIGDHVKKDQVLAVIDDPELQSQALAAQATLLAKREMAKAAAAAVQQSQSALEVSKRQLAGLRAEQKLMEVTLARQQELFAGKAATTQQIDEIQAKADVARAAADVGEAKIASAEADLRSAEANRSVADAQVKVAEAEERRVQSLLAYTKIVAPFDGVITRRLASPGDLVQSATGARTMPMFTCQKLDVVRVFCDVPETSAASIQIGTPADVQLIGAGGQVFHGKVTRISAAMNPQTRTMRAEIDLPNAEQKLMPGMYAQVTLTLSEKRDVAKTTTP